MSERITIKASYMQELDQWIEDKVFTPLGDGFFLAMDGDMSASKSDEVKKAIKEKVLESYKNGLVASQRRSSPPAQKGGR